MENYIRKGRTSRWKRYGGYGLTDNCLKFVIISICWIGNIDYVIINQTWKYVLRSCRKWSAVSWFCCSKRTSDKSLALNDSPFKLRSSCIIVDNIFYFTCLITDNASPNNCFFIEFQFLVNQFHSPSTTRRSCAKLFIVCVSSINYQLINIIGKLSVNRLKLIIYQIVGIYSVLVWVCGCCCREIILFTAQLIICNNV